MKSFFEEYGFVILAAIVVILLIAMCTPLGKVVRQNIESIMNSFSAKTNSMLNDSLNTAVNTTNDLTK